MGLEPLQPISDGDVAMSNRELKLQLHFHAYQRALESQRGVVYLNNVLRSIRRVQNQRSLHERQMHKVQESPLKCAQLLILGHHHRERL